MQTFLKPSFFRAALIFALIITAPAVHSAEATISEAKTETLSPEAALRKRLNLAGRQRLLSQRLIASGCFLSLDANADQNRKFLAETIETYRISLQMLRDGNTPLRLPSETNPAVLIALETAEDAWAEHAQFFQSWLTRRPTDADLREAQSYSKDLLQTSQAVIDALQASQTLSVQQAESARNLNIAGRQRLLAQRAIKDTCMASTKDVTANERLSRNRAVATTIAAFETSARSLAEGNEMMRVVQTPNQDALWGVEASTATWDEMRWILRDSIAGARLDQTALTQLSQKFEHLLPILEDTAWFYANF